MPVGTIVLRIPKGSPLTPAEMDTNLDNLRDFSNALELRMDVSLDVDGTILPGAVDEDALALDVLTKWYAEDTGTANNISVAYSPSPAALADLEGIPLRIQVAAANTGATQITVALQVGTASAPLRKGGLAAMQSGDLEVDQIILVQYSTDTGFFHLIGSVAQEVDNDAATTGASRFLTVRKSSATVVNVSVDGPGSLGLIGEVTLRDETTQRVHRATGVSVAINTGAIGINGFDVSTTAVDNTWYYIWLIYNGTTVAGLLSTSGTTPLMPSGYTYKALVGAVHNTGGGSYTLDNINEYSDRKRFISKEFDLAAGAYEMAPGIAITHNLGGIPRAVGWVVVKRGSAGASLDYSINDEIQISNVFTSTGDGACPFSTGANVNHVFCTQIGSDINIRHKTTGASTGVTEADWRVKCYAEL